jgi:hypothetical protein
MRRPIVVAAGLLVWASVASGASWGGIVPGETGRAEVMDRYGEPSEESRSKIGQHESTAWTYEGTRAPTGLIRMVVEFGILKDGKYAPDVVRTFRIEPKPGVFERRHVVLGWGTPDRGGMQDGVPVLIYKSGLTVYFDQDIINAISLWFTVPQPSN